MRVRRGTPIAARRQGSARRDLWPVRQGRALELALLEKAAQKDAQPALDLGEAVGAAGILRDVGRPRALSGVMPGVPGEIRDLRRGEAVASGIEQAEILQRV